MRKSKYAGIKAVYNKYKNEMNGLSYIHFRRQVLSRIEEDYNYSGFTYRQAAKKFMHSLAFTDKGTIAIENIIAGMKKFGIYQQFLALLGGRPRDKFGRFATYASTLTWDKTLKAWTFIGFDGTIYRIIVDNSPAAMSIEAVI